MEAAKFISCATVIDSSMDFYPHKATLLEYMVNCLLERGADSTKKDRLGNSAELYIEGFCKTYPNNVDMKRIFNTIKTYAAKFKTSESETSEAKTYAAKFKTSEETKEEPSL